MNGESPSGINRLNRQQLREFNDSQIDLFEQRFVHRTGIIKKDMVAVDELVPLIEIGENLPFANTISGKADFLNLSGYLNSPVALSEAILEMWSYSQKMDQEAANVIVSGRSDALQILPKSRKFGFYDEYIASYISGPKIYVPKRFVRCKMHSHPPGIQMVNHPFITMPSVEIMSVMADCFSEQDVANLLIEGTSSVDEVLSSILLVGNYNATLIARTLQSQPKIPYREKGQEETLMNELHDILRVDEALVIGSQNVANLQQLSNRYALATYRMGIENGQTEGIWQLL